MKVDASRLLSLLGGKEGFALARREPDEFALVRPSTLDGLFEHIEISGAGKSGEALGCDLAVSVVGGQLGTKGMCELELLAELATDPERGVTIVQTAEQAQDWERRVVEIAPPGVRALAQREGPALLARTARARAAVQAHLKQLPDTHDLDVLKRLLLGRLEPQRADVARRLAGRPGVLQKAGAELLYDVACMAIVLFEVGNQASAEVKLDPLEDRELMWRIQLLVDHIEARKRSADRRTARAGAR